MKILLWTRPNDTHGGDISQAEKTAEYLRQLGHHVDLIDAYKRDVPLGDYDIAHIFILNIRNIEHRIQKCIESNIPIVISPLYRDEKYE